MSHCALEAPLCRKRQQRLIAQLQKLDVELAIVTQAEHVQWLTGARFGPMFASAAALGADGHAIVVAPNACPDGLAVDQALSFEAQWVSTLRNDQRAASSAVLLDALGSRAKARRIGVEFSTYPQHLGQELQGELVDFEPTLYRLRRQKDEDELRMMRRAIAATEAMYAKARELIRPGIVELDLYCELHTAGVREAGEPLTYFGQDFQCNARGGPPRLRAAEAGELYILDLGAGYRGYFADNARTFSVGGQVSAAQQQAWDQVVKVFEMVETTVKTGVSCCELYAAAQTILDERRPWVFDHHLGHGIGLYPHEAPHLNPRWDDTFQVGEVFTVEPALYHDDLRHGLRLEQNYIVREDGIERLTTFPLEL